MKWYSILHFYSFVFVTALVFYSFLPPKSRLPEIIVSHQVGVLHGKGQSLTQNKKGGGVVNAASTTLIENNAKALFPSFTSIEASR